MSAPQYLAFNEASPLQLIIKESVGGVALEILDLCRCGHNGDPFLWAELLGRLLRAGINSYERSPESRKKLASSHNPPTA